MFPIHLANYFAPLDLPMFVLTLLIIFCWDITGFWFSTHIIKSPSWTRIGWWIYGWGIYILTVFILNFFFIFTRPLIVGVILVSALVTLPCYLKNRGINTLGLAFKSIWFPLVSVLVLGPVIWVYSSMPPYMYDEMAYHLVSPFYATVQHTWEFSAGIFQIVPQTIELLFKTTFMVFNTYSPARFIHFSLVFFTLLLCFNWVKLRFGSLRAILFWLLVWFLPVPELFNLSTSGYNDGAPTFFTLFGLMMATELFLSRNINLLPTVIAFWTLAIACKYTSFIPLVSIIPVSLIFVSRLIKNLNRKIIILSTATFLVFGGYWYVKNVIYRGNPIYPFIFPCRQGECVGNSGFFGTWTEKISPKSTLYIINLLLVESRKLDVVFIFALLIAFFSRSRNLKYFNLVFLGTIVIEFIIFKYFSGFYLRYHWHLQFALLLIIILQSFVDKKDYMAVKILKYALLMFLIVFVSLRTFRSYRFAYYPDKLPRPGLDYALGKTSLNDWIEVNFPRMSGVIKWCDSQTGDKPVDLITVDPDIVWYEYEGLIRIFMTNCQIINMVSNLKSPEDAYDILVTRFPEPRWYVSLNKCRQEKDIIRKPYYDDHRFQLQLINNYIVCRLTEKIPHLYY